MYGVTTRRPSSSQETRLPHGECRFILLHPEISGQRCSCQGFWLNKAVLGSSCECGHQACYHEPTQPQEALNRDQYDVLLSRVAHLEKQLSRTGASREEGTTSEGGDIKVVEEQLDREKSDREDDVRRVYRTFQGIYEQLSMSQKATFHRMLEQDDKIEGMVDKVTECSEELQTIRERFAQVDEVSMALEDRLDEMSEALERAESTIPHTKRRDPSPPRREAVNEGNRAV
ncbi:MAG: hypothetical protein M1838_004409 [Thelocarpon superellum]|nr:MAG: hypothetical protein M1838_004409 [Thelocarpon superellum]